MSKPDNCIAIDGKTFYTYEIKDEMGDGTGFYKDPLVEQDIHSRTFMPLGTVVIQFKDEAKMISEIKKTKYKFKDGDLSIKTKEKFKDEKIDDKIDKIKKDK